MKAYRIHNDVVAAESEDEAITAWAAHFDVEHGTAGPVEELDPTQFEVLYEQNDGSFKEGPITHLMPESGSEPQVIIDGDCCD